MDDRNKKEEETRLQKEKKNKAFEFEKLRLQAHNCNQATVISTHGPNHMQIDLKNVLPIFDPVKDDKLLFLACEAFVKFLNVLSDFGVSYVIGILPNSICKLVAG